MFPVKSFEFLLMTLAGYYRLQKTGKHYGINELLIFYKKKNLERNKDAHSVASVRVCLFYDNTGVLKPLKR